MVILRFSAQTEDRVFRGKLGVTPETLETTMTSLYLCLFFYLFCLSFFICLNSSFGHYYIFVYLIKLRAPAKSCFQNIAIEKHFAKCV